MGKTIKLVSVLLKCSPGSGGADNNKKITGRSLMNPILLFCLLPVIYYLFRGGILIQKVFGEIDEEGIILGLLLLVISGVIFVTGIASCMNSFYLSPNLNSLLVMPFTSSQITGAKFIVAALYEYVISFAVLAPVLAGIGYAKSAPFGFWVGMVLTVLLIPVVPLAYAAILSMVVMRIVGGAKNKERISALGIIGGFLLLSLYEIIRNVTSGMKINAIEDVIVQLGRTLRRLNGVFPDIPFLIRVMEKRDMLSALWACIVVIAVMAVFHFASRYFYFSGAVGMQEAAVSRKKMSEKQLLRVNRQSGVVWSYTKKELRTILRTPAYYMSCLFLTLGWPLVLVVPAFFSQAEKNEAISLEKLLYSSQSTAYYIFLLFCVVFAVTIFVATLNGIAPSSISREGKSFPVMKQIPVSFRKQLKAKRNAALLICWIGSGGYLTVGMVLLSLLKGFPWWSVLPTIIFNLLLLYIIIDLEMICGLLWPGLSRESGEQSYSGRFGFVLFLLGIMAGCAMVFGLTGWVKSLSCGPWIFMAGVCGILLAAAIVVDVIFYLYGEKRLERLSDIP